MSDTEPMRNLATCRYAGCKLLLGVKRAMLSFTQLFYNSLLDGFGKNNLKYMKDNERRLEIPI